MKKKFTLLAALFFAAIFNLANAQQVFFREGFFDDPANNLPSAAVDARGYFNQGNSGTWYSAYTYRTTGGGANQCSANGNTLSHIRFSSSSPAPDSPYIITPIVPAGAGIHSIWYLNSRASRRFTIFKSSDTLATTSNWVEVAHFPNTNLQCDAFTVSINDPNARRVKIVGRQASDSDMDSIVLFTINAVQPVKFASTKAYLNNGGVKIDWNIAAEENVAEYIIERSASSNDFVSVGSVKANNAKQYSYFDAAPLSGNNFYRIKVLDKDGSVMYSNILKVNTVRGSAEMNVAPNPVKGNALNVQFAGIEKGTYSLRLVNNVGQQVFVKTINGETSSFTQSFTLPTTVAKGIYSLQLLSSSTKLEKKIIIE